MSEGGHEGLSADRARRRRRKSTSFKYPTQGRGRPPHPWTTPREHAVHAITTKLVALIAEHGWKDHFARAIKNAQAHDVPGIRDIRTPDDFLHYVDRLVTWTPHEHGDSRFIYDQLVKFYFFLDQEPLKGLQSAIKPATQPQQLAPLSAWIVEFARAWGSYLDTLESAREVESFRTDPIFNWDEYMPSPSGYKTVSYTHLTLPTNREV